VDPKDRLPAEWPDLDVEETLRRLVAAGVDFVVVGGIAMILLGSSRLTRDVDIVVATDEANLESLGGVLVGLNATSEDELAQIRTVVVNVSEGEVIYGVLSRGRAALSGTSGPHIAWMLRPNAARRLKNALTKNEITRLREIPDKVPFVPGWLDVALGPLPGAPAFETLRKRAERHNLGDFSALVASPDDMLTMKRAAAGRDRRSGRPHLADIEELKAIKRLRRRGTQG
jgi:Nucleotidyl transferase of unknown function (DUF2204)